MSSLPSERPQPGGGEAGGRTYKQAISVNETSAVSVNILRAERRDGFRSHGDERHQKSGTSSQGREVAQAEAGHSVRSSWGSEGGAWSQAEETTDIEEKCEEEQSSAWLEPS